MLRWHGAVEDSSPSWLARCISPVASTIISCVSCVANSIVISLLAVQTTWYNRWLPKPRFTTGPRNGESWSKRLWHCSMSNSHSMTLVCPSHLAEQWCTNLTLSFRGRISWSPFLCFRASYSYNCSCNRYRCVSTVCFELTCFLWYSSFSCLQAVICIWLAFTDFTQNRLIEFIMPCLGSHPCRPKRATRPTHSGGTRRHLERTPLGTGLFVARK